MLRLSGIVVAARLVCPAAVVAQSGTTTSDTSRYLIEVTQEAAARSPVGDLSRTVFAASDIELRVWYGYGVVGTRGIVLRRRAGGWTLSDAKLDRCVVIVPSPAGDTLSAKGELAYESTALSHCVEDPPGEGRWLAFERVVVTRRASDPDLEGAWTRLSAAGLDSLPGVRRSTPGLRDGASLVIELRRGALYRASELSCHPAPEEPQDPRVDRFVSEIAALFPSGTRIKC